MAVDVAKNPDRSRYEGWVDGELAGFAGYVLARGVVVFSHTEVDPSFEGQGVGSAIARAALDAVRAEGDRRVVAVCPFITAFIGRHPEYQDLLHTTPETAAGG